jgi:hypothetical protein
MAKMFAELEQLVIDRLVRLNPSEEHLDVEVRCPESPTRFLAPTEESPACR